MPLPAIGELQKEFFEAAQAAARRHGFEIAQNAGSQLRDMARIAAESILSRAQQLVTENEQFRYVAANAQVGSIGMATIVEQMIAARETLPNYAATYGARLGEETLAEAKRLLCPSCSSADMAATPQPLESLKASNALVGQLITVSVALLTFTVTFAKEFKPVAETVLHVPVSLKVSWILLLLTAVCGFWALGAIAGTMKELERGSDSNPNRTNINIPIGLMFVLFLSALVSLVVAGWTVAG